METKLVKSALTMTAHETLREDCFHWSGSSTGTVAGLSPNKEFMYCSVRDRDSYRPFHSEWTNGQTADYLSLALDFSSGPGTHSHTNAVEINCAVSAELLDFSVSFCETDIMHVRQCWMSPLKQLLPILLFSFFNFHTFCISFLIYLIKLLLHCRLVLGIVQLLHSMISVFCFSIF